MDAPSGSSGILSSKCAVWPPSRSSDAMPELATATAAPPHVRTCASSRFSRCVLPQPPGLRMKNVYVAPPARLRAGRGRGDDGVVHGALVV